MADSGPEFIPISEVERSNETLSPSALCTLLVQIQALDWKHRDIEALAGVTMFCRPTERG